MQIKQFFYYLLLFTSSSLAWSQTPESQPTATAMRWSGGHIDAAVMTEFASLQSLAAQIEFLATRHQVVVVITDNATQGLMVNAEMKQAREQLLQVKDAALREKRYRNYYTYAEYFRPINLTAQFLPPFNREGADVGASANTTKIMKSPETLPYFDQPVILVSQSAGRFHLLRCFAEYLLYKEQLAARLQKVDDKNYSYLSYQMYLTFHGVDDIGEKLTLYGVAAQMQSRQALSALANLQESIAVYLPARYETNRLSFGFALDILHWLDEHADQLKLSIADRQEIRSGVRVLADQLQPEMQQQLLPEGVPFTEDFKKKVADTIEPLFTAGRTAIQAERSWLAQQSAPQKNKPLLWSGAVLDESTILAFAALPSITQMIDVLQIAFGAKIVLLPSIAKGAPINPEVAALEKKQSLAPEIIAAFQAYFANVEARNSSDQYSAAVFFPPYHRRPGFHYPYLGQPGFIITTAVNREALIHEFVHLLIYRHQQARKEVNFENQPYSLASSYAVQLARKMQVFQSLSARIGAMDAIAQKAEYLQASRERHKLAIELSKLQLNEEIETTGEELDVYHWMFDHRQALKLTDADIKSVAAGHAFATMDLNDMAETVQGQFEFLQQFGEQDLQNDWLKEVHPIVLTITTKIKQEIDWAVSSGVAGLIRR